MAVRTDDVLAERAAIDRLVEGRTICHVLAANAEQHPGDPALSSQDESGAWNTLTWKDYRDQVAAATLGLRRLGVRPGDFVAIMTRNRPEHVVADLAVVHAGGTPVSFYNTLAPEQIAYIAGHCEAKIAVVEGPEFLERWEKARADLPALERVIVLQDAEDAAGRDWVVTWQDVLSEGRRALDAPGGRDEFEESWRRVKPDDLATLHGTAECPVLILTKPIRALHVQEILRLALHAMQPRVSPG